MSEQYKENIINFIQTHNDEKGQLVSILNTLKEEDRPFKMEVIVGKQLKSSFKAYLTSVVDNPRIRFTMKNELDSYVSFIAKEGVVSMSPCVLHIPLWGDAITILSFDFGFNDGLDFRYKSKVNHADYWVSIRFNR